MNESNFLKTLDKLTNGSRLMNESEIMEFLSSVVSIVDKYKQGTDEVNSSLLSKMDETLDIIEQIVTGHTENTTNTLSSAKSELETLHSGHSST